MKEHETGLIAKTLGTFKSEELLMLTLAEHFVRSIWEKEVGTKASLREKEEESQKQNQRSLQTPVWDSENTKPAIQKIRD